MSCIQFFAAGTIMLICMFIFEEPSLKSILAAKYTILYTGIMSCGVAYTFQMIGQKYTEPAAATLIMSLESVFAALAGLIILNEHMNAKEIAGCALVFAAVVLSQLDIGSNKRITLNEKGNK
jgi:drug/metabolite transporter (DMT)-like permease